MEDEEDPGGSLRGGWVEVGAGVLVVVLGCLGEGSRHQLRAGMTVRLVSLTVVCS